MATKLSDEQYGRFCAVNDDFRRRVREGEIPLDNATEIMRRAIRGQGYLGNQITEGDDIRLAIESMKSRNAPDLEIAIHATGMAAIGGRYDRVPAQYRIIASIVIDDLNYNGTSITQYVRGRFFHHLPISKGHVFSYWHELVSGEEHLDFPNSHSMTLSKTGLVTRMLTNIGGPVLEKIHKGTILYLLQDGRVLTNKGTNIS